MNNVENLKVLLTKHNINFSQWGKNGTKSVSKLFNELQTGDSKLIESNGTLLRESSSVWLNVSRNNIPLKVLREKRQLRNGKVIKVRSNEHPVTEKIMNGETIRNAVIRGLKEELNLNRNMYVIQNPSHTEQKIQNSVSYPGLKARYTKYYRWIVLKSKKMPSYMKNEEFTTINHNNKHIVWRWNNKHNYILKRKTPTLRPISNNSQMKKTRQNVLQSYTQIHPEMKILNNEKPILFIVLGPMGAGKSSFNYKKKFGKNFTNFIINNVVEKLPLYKQRINELLPKRNITTVEEWKTLITNKMRENASKIYKNVRKYSGISEIKEVQILNSIEKRENIMIESTGNITSNIYEKFENILYYPLLDNNYQVYFVNVFSTKDIAYSRALQREFKSFQQGQSVRLLPPFSAYSKSYNITEKHIQEKMMYYLKTPKYNSLIKNIFYLDTSDKLKITKVK